MQNTTARKIAIFKARKIERMQRFIERKNPLNEQSNFADVCSHWTRSEIVAYMKLRMKLATEVQSGLATF